MSDIDFWKPAYQLFDYDRPLATWEELEKFYVQRVNSPMGNLGDFQQRNYPNC